MDDLRAEWLKAVKTLKEALERVVRFLVDLSLQIEGIVPEAAPYDVVFAESSLETHAEAASRVQDLAGSRLVSRRRAVSLLAPQTGVDDVEAELAEIDKETEAEALRAAKTAPPGDKDKNGRDPD